MFFIYVPNGIQIILIWRNDHAKISNDHTNEKHLPLKADALVDKAEFRLNRLSNIYISSRIRPHNTG
jgi:hypothetical protein